MTGEVNFTPVAPIVAQTKDTVTYKLTKEQAAPLNKCGFDLQSRKSIMVEVPKNNKDGSFILRAKKTFPDNFQFRDYCAFDGNTVTGSFIGEHLGLGNIPESELSIYSNCGIKSDGKTIHYDCHNTSTDETPYFLNGKIVRPSDK